MTAFVGKNSKSTRLKHTMKKNFSLIQFRAAAGAFFLGISVVLIVLAAKIDILHATAASGAKINRQERSIGLLVGPQRYRELAAQFAKVKQPANVKQPDRKDALTAIPLAPQDVSNYVGYENFTAPGVLTPVKTTEAGQQVNSVEYMGRNAGEPSVGSNWATGVANFQSGLQTLFITFNDLCPANGLSATWVNRAAPSSVVIDSDPIGFTDRGFTDPLGFHSRVWAGELTLLSPNTVKISYSDDDGLTWIGPTQSGGPASAVDHESIGAGPYRNAPNEVPPVIPTPATTYPNAVYYCSQDIAAAFCAKSDTGGLTYGGSIPLYNLTQCGGLHGHVKVTPSTPQTLANGSAGVAYVPNPSCTGAQAVVVTSDNGATWTVRKTPIATPGGSGVGSDAAVGIDANGRVYFAGAAGGSTAIVATSDNRGQTWQNIFDVSSALGLNQIAFPAAVAGDAGRAAVAFYGSTGTGNSNASTYNGVWHLYVSHTFDGGATWTTTDVTPNAPMQRSGLLRGGGANLTTNLLDFFDMTIDNQGRVLVGYVDGCEGGNCKQAVANAGGNAYTVTATIARQSSGRRLLAGFDPSGTTEAPGMPSVSWRRIGRTVHLAWSEADTGNSPITGFQIMRGIAPNTETLLTTVTGTQSGGTFDDLTATDTTKTYYYKVVAINAVGSSCPNNEIAAPYICDACTGLVMHKNDPTHPEANAGANTPASLLIDYVAMGEPASSPGNFIFKMKVNDLSTVPPNSRWRIVVTSPAAESYPSVANDPVSGAPLFAQQFYVGMTTGPSGPAIFEYGTLSDAGAPAVFVISETKQGDGLPGSNFNPDGMITIIAPKIAFGFQTPSPTAPPIGTLFGGVNGRTITGDNSDCATGVPGCTPNNRLERSNAFVDHTFAKAQADNGYPAATYTVLGNDACEGGIVPLGAVSRKTHDSISPPFDIDLPLSGNIGIECRVGQGASSNDHQVVVTFPGAITLVGTPTVSSGTGSVSAALTSGSQVFINLTGVTNAQRIGITLTVNDGVNTAPIVVPMGVLLGDTTGNGFVNSGDVSQPQAQSGQPVTASNFRQDVTANGFINSADVSVVQSKSGTSLP